MATQIEMLEEIINDPKSSPDNVKRAQDTLNKLQAVGGAQIQTASLTGEGDAELMAVLNALQSALKSGGGNVSMSDIRKAVSDELAKRKITETDLAPSLLAFLNSTLPFMFFAETIPVSEIISSVSITLKTRSEATTPICNVFKRSANIRIGRNTMLIIMIKKVISPNLRLYELAFTPANQINKAIDTADKISTTGKKTE